MFTAARFRRTALDRDQQRHELRGAPESVLRYLEMARAEAGPGEKRGSLNTWSETLYSSIVSEAALTAAAEAIVFPTSANLGYYGGVSGGYMKTGRTLRLRVAGQASTAATPGTALWALRWGGIAGNVLVKSNGASVTGTAVTMTASQTNVYWRAELYVTCRTEGLLGSLFAHGIFESALIPTSGYVTFPLTAPAAVTSLDLVNFKDLAFTHSPSLGTASFAGMSFMFESMN